MLELRDYQQQAIDELRRGVANGHRRQILTLPTGSGKTEVACGLIESVTNKRGKVLFIVDRLTLKDQGAERFRGYNFQVGVIQGDNTDYRHDDDVHVATAQTLWSRMKTSPLSLDCQLIVVDEAHILFQAHRKIFERMDKTPVIGLTATPHHRELGKWYSNMVTGATTQQMIDRGRLVPFRVFMPQAQVDTAGLRMQANDYNTKQLGERVKLITADVVSNWQAKAENRPTLAFCVNVSHAEEMAYEFNQAGIPAGWLYHKTPQEDREELFRQFAAGDLRVLCSVTALTAGFDMPLASCAIVARPTASEALHIQMLGRVARPADGKTDSLVFDHAGNCKNHGLPQDYIPPTLEEVEQRSSPKRDSEKSAPSTCKNCHAVMRSRERICDNCGHERALASKIIVVDGQLVEAGSEVPKDVTESHEFRYQFLAELRGYARTKRKKNGEPFSENWSGWKYKERFNDWPRNHGIRDLVVEPLPPGDAVLRWIHNNDKRHAIAGSAVAKKLTVSLPEWDGTHSHIANCDHSNAKYFKGKGKHHAQVRCVECGHFSRWAGAQEVIQKLGARA